MARWSLRVATALLVFALATWQFGWLSVPVAGFTIGVLRPLLRLGPFSTGIAAALAWAAFLAANALLGDVGVVAQLVGAQSGVSPTVVIGAVIAFPLLSAASAAAAGGFIGARIGVN